MHVQVFTLLLSSLVHSQGLDPIFPIPEELTQSTLEETLYPTLKSLNINSQESTNSTQETPKPLAYAYQSTSRNGFDWRDRNGVSPVKDQQACSDCWAFSAIANIESQYWMRNMPVVFSEKFLLDCNKMGADCNITTATGVVNTFADIILNLGGVLPAEDYLPYNGRKDQCIAFHGDQLKPVIGFQRVQPFNERKMMEALVKHGPLSAAMNPIMMERSPRNVHGIDRPRGTDCPNDKASLGHAVLIVGFDISVDANGVPVPYWIIKNSWGLYKWLDQGYYYLEMGTNACGIASDVSFATVPDDF